MAAERTRVTEDPVGQVAGDARQERAQRDRPPHRADAPAQPEHDHHGDDSDTRGPDGELGAGAEGRPGVAGEVELQDLTDDLYVVASGQAIDGQDLADHVAGVENGDDGGEEGPESRPSGYGGGACPRPLPTFLALLACHTQCRTGEAIALIFPIGSRHDSQMP